jgi:hypothetical protein
MSISTLHKGDDDNNNNNKSPPQSSYKLLAVQATLTPNCNKKFTHINRQGKNLPLCDRLPSPLCRPESTDGVGLEGALLPTPEKTGDFS